MERREFMAGAMAGAAVGVGTEAAAGGGRDEGAEVRLVAEELRRYRNAAVVRTELEPIRVQQRIYLKSTGKYPDYIEVGLEIWEQVYDWHVRWQQPLSLTRLPDGGYGMAVLLTTLVLKPNMQPAYVGPGYDAR